MLSSLHAAAVFNIQQSNQHEAARVEGVATCTYHAHSSPTQVNQKVFIVWHRKKRIMISVELTDFQSELQSVLLMDIYWLICLCRDWSGVGCFWSRSPLPWGHIILWFRSISYWKCKKHIYIHLNTERTPTLLVIATICQVWCHFEN